MGLPTVALPSTYRGQAINPPTDLRLTRAKHSQRFDRLYLARDAPLPSDILHPSIANQTTPLAGPNQPRQDISHSIGIQFSQSRHSWQRKVRRGRLLGIAASVVCRPMTARTGRPWRGGGPAIELQLALIREISPFATSAADSPGCIPLDSMWAGGPLVLPHPVTRIDVPTWQT